MSDQDTINRLRAAFDDVTRDHHFDPDLLSADPARRSWRTPLAVAACLVAVLAVATLAVLVRGHHSDPTPPAAGDCAVSTDLLPDWAQDGFGPNSLHTPHVIGADDQIVAILFVPLRAHQPAGTFNKVLWVARQPGGPLVVDAQLPDGTHVTRTLANTGPSYLDLPAAGCWQLTLTWPGHTDTLSLRYQ